MSETVEVVLWVLIVVGVANLLTLALLWRGVFQPLSQDVDRLTPVIDTLAKGYPDLVRVLQTMESTAHTTELSLRDAVSMLEGSVVDSRSAAVRDRAAGEVLRVNLHDDRLLASQDREQLEKLLILLDRLGVKVDAGGATGLRIEAASKGVASDLATAKEAVEGVATDLAVSQKAVASVAEDLAAAHLRADEAEGPHGAAADAAASSAKEKEAVKEAVEKAAEDRAKDDPAT